MFIGGASGSTAGGIKVNTFSVLLIAIVSTVRGRPSAEAFGRRVPHDVVYRALSVALLSIAFVFAVAFRRRDPGRYASSSTRPSRRSRRLARSASRPGITPELPDPARLLVAFAMFVGRLGPLTLVLAAGRPAAAGLAPTRRRVDADRSDELEGVTMKQSVLVIGLGRFGTAAARELMALGHEVLVGRPGRSPGQRHRARRDPRRPGRRERRWTRSGAVGAGDFDHAIVAISSDAEPSIFATMALKNLGVQNVIAKAGTALHGSILERVGATRVVYPGAGDGRPGRPRVRYDRHVIDYLDIAPGFGIVRFSPPPRLDRQVASRRSTCRAVSTDPRSRSGAATKRDRESAPRRGRSSAATSSSYRARRRSLDEARGRVGPDRASVSRRSQVDGAVDRRRDRAEQRRRRVGERGAARPRTGGP